ncbi:hypothetical protein [Candidatus Tisiphia endosymbiont of Temnostethus pusillus]|uniref:hypothetical protein n=1 Tax=Candidatus Tisiphia endosymbiont of Temnostethus pusillus TaxID=3139335 RepID=UPI0035C89458
MTFKELLEKIKNNTLSSGLLDLREYDIKDEEVKKLGEVLKYNDRVWYVDLANKQHNITNEAFKSFAENIKLNGRPIEVECNDTAWNYLFMFIKRINSQKTSNLDQKAKDEWFTSMVVAGHSHDSIIEYLLKHTDETYSFSINGAIQGRTIANYYMDRPDIQKLLFAHGYIPRELPANHYHDLQDIIHDTQSVHNSTVVRATNSYIKDMLEQLKASDKQLDQAAVQTITTIENLSNITSKAEYTPFLLSNLPEDRKKDIFYKIPEDHKLNYLQDNKQAMRAIIAKAVDILKNLYVKINVDGKYDGTYANYNYCYDYLHGKNLQLPRAIGAVKLFIDSNYPNEQEIQELYVSSISKYLTIETDESKILSTLTKIKQLLNKDELTIEELKSQEACHNLLINCNATQQQIKDLFQDLNNCSVEEVWKVNKMSELAMQLYMAATTYGPNDSACNQGTLTQVIHTLAKVSSQFINNFALREAETKEEITENNIGDFMQHIVDKLIVTCEKKGLSKELLEFIACEMDMDFNKTTHEQQKVFAEINKLFLENIRDYLPEYAERNPLATEYQIMINALRQTKKMQDFASQHNTEQLTKQDKQFIVDMKHQQEEQATKLQEQQVKVVVEDMLDALKLSETGSKYFDDPIAAYKSLLGEYGSIIDFE